MDPPPTVCRWAGCMGTFSKPPELWMHIRKCHTGEPARPGDPIHTCSHPNCSQMFSRSTELRLHVAMDHFEEQTSCPQCTFTTCVKETLEKHMVLKHRAGCTTCGKVSKSWRDHTVHARKHNMHLHPCNLDGCMHTFATLGALNRHIRGTHNAAYRCQHCHQLMSSSGRLRQHVMACIPKMKARAAAKAARLAAAVAGPPVVPAE